MREAEHTEEGRGQPSLSRERDEGEEFRGEGKTSGGVP